jgi:catalase
MPLFEKAGFAPDLDAGCIELGAADDATRFVKIYRELRFWRREPSLKS